MDADYDPKADELPRNLGGGSVIQCNPPTRLRNRSIVESKKWIFRNLLLNIDKLRLILYIWT